MTNEGSVSGFWETGNTLERIRDALEKAGLSLDRVTIQDLAPVDHLHARGLPATVDLANRLLIERGCVFRRKRSPIPTDCDHLFRLKPIT